MTNSKKEIMTLDEVSAYLRISEKEVLELVNKGEIPGAKLGETWRFKQSEIENRINSKLSPKLNNNHINGISLKSILSIDRITFIREDSKKGALNQMIDLFLSIEEINNSDEITDVIHKREQLMSTGIGLSIAVPHARINSINNVYMAIGVCEKDIIDYESLDGQPVRIIVMILAGKNQHTQYIQTLSQISRLLKDEQTRARLLQTKSEDEVYKIMTGEEEE